MKYIIALVFLFTLSNLKVSHSITRSSINKIYTNKYVIFNYADEHWPISFNSNSKSYSLSQDDIKQIEFLLQKEVFKTNKEGKEKIIKNPGRFYKQFIAIYDSNGEKVVWVNCMCDVKDDPNWRKKIIVVLDGGPCHFNFKVNLTTGQIYDFAVNGEG